MAASATVMAIHSRHRLRYEDNIDYGDDEEQSDSLAFMEKSKNKN